MFNFGFVQVVYSDNPQRDSVDIVGIMEFPNLEFETQVGLE